MPSHPSLDALKGKTMNDDAEWPYRVLACFHCADAVGWECEDAIGGLQHAKRCQLCGNIRLVREYRSRICASAIRSDMT